MRHRVKGRKLSRTASHRQATLNALATQLLRYKKIKTTTAKAKETKRFVEPLITKAKKNDLSSKRYIARFIKDKDVLKELFSEIVEKIGDRPGGYTRVVKLGNRSGDAAELSIIELVDYNEIAAPKKKESKEKEETKAKKSKKAPKKEEAVEAEVVEEKETNEEETAEKEEKAEKKKTTKAKSTTKKKTEEAKEEKTKETKTAEAKKESDEKAEEVKEEKKEDEKKEEDKSESKTAAKKKEDK